MSADSGDSSGRNTSRGPCDSHNLGPLYPGLQMSGSAEAIGADQACDPERCYPGLQMSGSAEAIGAIGTPPPGRDPRFLARV
jgi:hypothetical protein